MSTEIEDTPLEITTDRNLETEISVKKKKTTKLKFGVLKCIICKKHFEDKYSLKHHIQTHSETYPFPCTMCSYKGKTKKYLNKHVKVVHVGNRNVKCEMCGKSFHYKSLLLKHMRIHTGEKPYKCEVCGKAFNSSYSLGTHKYIHTDEKPFQCTMCDYACRDSSTLRKHRDRHLGISTIFQCKLCDHSCKSKYQLKLHVAEKHLEVDVKKFACDTCGKKFKERCNLTNHIQAVHERSRMGQCEVCDAWISNRSNMAAHLLTHLDVRPFACTFTDCTKRYKDQQTLKRHTLTHFPEQQLQCPTCPRRFTRLVRLRAHERTHVRNTARDRRDVCRHCGDRFYNKTYLEKHIKQKHSKNRKKYMCDDCEFVTHNKPSIVMHVKYGHIRKRPHRCDVCNKGYKRDYNLKLHYSRRHKDKDDREYDKLVDIKKEPKGYEFVVDVKTEPVEETPLDEYSEQICDEYNDKNIMDFDIDEMKLSPQQFNSDDEIGNVIDDETSSFTKENETPSNNNTVKSNTDEITPLVSSSQQITSNLETNDGFPSVTEIASTSADINLVETNKIPNQVTLETNNDLDPNDETNNEENVNTIGNLDKNIEQPNNTDMIIKATEQQNREIYTVAINGNVSINKDSQPENIEISQTDKQVDVKEKNMLYFNKDINQDLARTIIENNGKQLGKIPESIFDDFYIKHVKVLPDETEQPDGHIDKKQKQYLNNYVNKVLKRTKTRYIKPAPRVNKSKNVNTHKHEKEPISLRKKRNGKAKRKANNKKNIEQSNINISAQNDEGKAATGDPCNSASDENKNQNNGKLIINTHQCYVCFKLFETKGNLLEHCKEHFQLCSSKTLKKCPLCEYVTYLSLTKHMHRIHKLNIKIPYRGFKDNKSNSRGSRYFYDVNDSEISKIEIIPSVKNLNKRAYMKIDKQNREKRDKSIAKTKLVRKGKEWIVEKQRINIISDNYIIPEINRKHTSVKSKGKDDHLKRMQKMSRQAKKDGTKMLFPCEDCDKICLTLSALKLHSRRHDPNAKPYKQKVWKHKMKGKPVETELIVDKEHRFSKPKPVTNKHKCEPELIDFYENNIKGKDIEFWQFLKIYNRMGRENINDFNDLEHRMDFGLHSIQNEDTTSIDKVPNTENDNNLTDNVRETVKTQNKNYVEPQKKLKAIKRKGYVRIIRISRKDHIRRNAVKMKMRQKIAMADNN